MYGIMKWDDGVDQVMHVSLPFAEITNAENVEYNNECSRNINYVIPFEILAI